METEGPHPLTLGGATLGGTLLAGMLRERPMSPGHRLGPPTDVEGWTMHPSLPSSAHSGKHGMYTPTRTSTCMRAPGPVMGTCHRNTGRVDIAHGESSAFFLGFSKLSLLP